MKLHTLLAATVLSATLMGQGFQPPPPAPIDPAKVPAGMPMPCGERTPLP